ncbi:hypothetical protein AABB24_016016, partial [Solanum stoloniferum]
ASSKTTTPTCLQSKRVLCFSLSSSPHVSIRFNIVAVGKKHASVPISSSGMGVEDLKKSMSASNGEKYLKFEISNLGLGLARFFIGSLFLFGTLFSFLYIALCPL